MTTLDVAQKVLCRSGYFWLPGVIISVREHLHADIDLLLPLAGAPAVLQRDNNNDIDVLLFLAGAPPLQRDNNNNNDNEEDGDDESSIDEEDFPRLQVGDVVPYRVVLTTPLEGIAMPGSAAAGNNNSSNSEPQCIVSIAAEGGWFIQKLDGFKIIKIAGLGYMDEEVWKAALTSWLGLSNEKFDNNEEQVMDEAKRLVKHCVKTRSFLDGAAYIATLKSIPLHRMGHELWQCFVSGDAKVIHTKLPEAHVVQSLILVDYITISEWLDGECGITDSHLATQHFFADDETKKSRHAEHVAAINGDVMMLCFLLESKYAYCRMPSHRPKPRNERVLQELLAVADDLKESLPRDDDGWTPLHHAAARGHVGIIDLYRIKGEQRSSCIWINAYFPGIDEFHAKTLNGQTALDLACNDSIRESLLKLQERLYQCILNGAMRTGHLPAGMADFAELESLVDEYGLDIMEARIRPDEEEQYRHYPSLMEPYSRRDPLTVALMSGNPIQVHFLARDRDLTDLKTWRSQDGLGMLHVAAGHTASWYASVRSDESYLLEQWQIDQADPQRDKLLFIEHHWNHGNAAFFNEGKIYLEEGFAAEQPSYFRLTTSQYERQCQETADTTRKLQLVQWLIQQGVTLPEYSFIIHNCNFAIAKFLLEYRMKTDRFINEQFQDKAPLAMVGVKQFLYGNAQDASLAASDVALCCVQRPAYDKLLGITDACRLLLLDWLDSNGYVDLVKIRNLSGNSILHEAVCNKETVIAVWLARKFPQLAHTRSKTSGKLPVHVALERVTDQDDCVEKAICRFMIHYAGEGRRGFGTWKKDKRAWALDDSNGRTVNDYAMSCCVEDVRKEALKPDYQKANHQMLEMALDQASSIQLFESHAQRNNLEDYKSDNCSDEIRFFHSCISLGRLDILQWYGQAFCHGGDNSSNHGLGRHFSSGRLDKWLPRVFCAPSETFSVEDCLEVLGRCRRMKGVDLDGSWMLFGWDLFSNSTHTVKIENGICRAEGCQVPGLEGATLRECSSANSSGSIRLLLHANDEGEYWYSTHVNQSIEGAVGMICLKRKAARNTDGYESWADNGREIVLTKMEDATGEASEALIWQRARVVASNNQDLTIEFPEADPPIQEIMPQDSSRINRTGSYKLDYLSGPLAMLNVYGSKNDETILALMTGLDLARRYGHAHIVHWIEEETSLSMMWSKLHEIETDFYTQFFSNAPTQDLDQTIHEARMIASSMYLSDRGASMVSYLQDELYVLGHLWMSQKSLPYHGDTGGYNYCEHNELGFFRCAAQLGRLDRVEWLIGHGFDSNSDVAKSVLFDAAYGNHVHVLEALLSKGVDGTRPLAFSGRGDGLGPDGHRHRQYTLLNVAVTRLSGDVVSFLIGHGYIPTDRELLRNAVGQVFLHRSKAAMKNRMVADRLSILKELVSGGLTISDSATEIMRIALRSLDNMLTEEKIRSSSNGEMVPITREVICWLCAQGSDLASAVQMDPYLRNGDVPDKIADLLRLSETVWPVAGAISRGEPLDEVERLVQRSGTSIHAIRDPLGRTLVQVAVLSDQAQHLEWLVTVKGVSMDEQDSDGLTILDLARQNGLQHIVGTINRLRQLQSH